MASDDLVVVPVRADAAAIRGAARRIARAVPDAGLILTLDPTQPVAGERRSRHPEGTLEPASTSP